MMSIHVIHPLGRTDAVEHLPDLVEACRTIGAQLTIGVWNPDLTDQAAAHSTPMFVQPGARLAQIVRRFLHTLPDSVELVGRVDDDVTPTPDMLTSLDPRPLGVDALSAWPWEGDPPRPDVRPRVTSGCVHLADYRKVTPVYAESFPAWSRRHDVDAGWSGTVIWQRGDRTVPPGIERLRET
jgi:hypothetical protein